LKPYEYLIKTAQETRAIQDAFLRDSAELLVAAAQMLGSCIQQGGKVLIMGNGGSAADAQHMAAEMVGRMLIDRRPLPAIALTTDTSNLTAVGNDFGFDHVFLKQIQALARPSDVVIAISTSGNSKNVILAVEQARSMGCKVIVLTGGSGGKLKTMSDICLCAALGTNSSRIQESHIFAVHSMVDLLDRFFLPEVSSNSGGMR
jgi:D-sedoheptulose 7-phosphate isomerase